MVEWQHPLFGYSNHMSYSLKLLLDVLHSVSSYLSVGPRPMSEIILLRFRLKGASQTVCKYGLHLITEPKPRTLH